MLSRQDLASIQLKDNILWELNSEEGVMTYEGKYAYYELVVTFEDIYINKTNSIYAIYEIDKEELSNYAKFYIANFKGLDAAPVYSRNENLLGFFSEYPTSYLPLYNPKEDITNRFLWVTGWWDCPRQGVMFFEDNWAYFDYIADPDYKTIAYAIYALDCNEVAKLMKDQIYDCLVWGTQYTYYEKRERGTANRQSKPKWLKEKIGKYSPKCKELLGIIVYK
jgi:hypothetical protein